MAKTTISTKDYLALVGLLVLAERHDKVLEDIRTSAMEITGEEERWGHTSDAVYDPGSRDVDSLLDKLGIEVAD